MNFRVLCFTLVLSLYFLTLFYSTVSGLEAEFCPLFTVINHGGRTGGGIEMEGRGMRREKGFGRVSWSCKKCSWPRSIGTVKNYTNASNQKEFTEKSFRKSQRLIFSPHSSTSKQSFKIYRLPFPGYSVWLLLCCFCVFTKGLLLAWRLRNLARAGTAQCSAEGVSVAPSNTDRDLGFCCEV